MKFKNKDIALRKQAGKSIKIPQVIRQREIVTQLQCRSEYTCDQ